MKGKNWVILPLIVFLTTIFSVYVLTLKLDLQSQLAAITLFIFLISLYLLLGIPELVEKLKENIRFNCAKVFGIALILLIMYAFYALSVAGFRWEDVGIYALYLFIPAFILLVARPKTDGLTIQDVLVITTLWVPLLGGWIRLVSIPVEHGESLDRVLGLIWGIFLFLVVRPLERVGYTFQLHRNDIRWAGLYFAVFVAFFAIPIAVPTHFITIPPTLKSGTQIFISLVLIAFSIALPEELVFRGVIHNLISQRLKEKPYVALMISSAIFGLSHIHRPDSPNWVYVILATLAGWFYGLTYIRTGKVTAAAITHWLVDSYWRIFFQ
ncbi:MAG TPA: CPBP family intramembrane glutamic endopeptidase [Candidatus Limnocylindrales bacterium]|nr:CPBP family intramembrane glutamic endopeptidase [Candidatus Limnocylindrales bacterium]